MPRRDGIVWARLSFVYNIVQTKERHAHDQDVCE